MFIQFEGRRKIVDYYTDRDLDLGVTLKIFGSDVFLYDCDAFTKNYYLSTYNKGTEQNANSYYINKYMYMCIRKVYKNLLDRCEFYLRT